MKPLKFSIKSLLFIAMALALGQAAQARDTEVSVGYGAIPAMAHVKAYRGGWNDITPWGSFSFTIDHRFAERLWIGLDYTVSSASSDHVSPLGNGDVTWHALMVNARMEWLRRGRLTAYSHAGIGVIINYFSPSWRDSYNSTRFAFQASPIGVQWDVVPAVGVFAEAGYGIQGIVKAGVRVGF